MKKIRRRTRLELLIIIMFSIFFEKGYFCLIFENRTIIINYISVLFPLEFKSVDYGLGYYVELDS